MMMSKIALYVTLTFSLVGCQLFSGPEPYVPPEPVEVRTVEVRPEIFQPLMPQNLRLEDVRWFVITRDNLEEKIEEVERLTGNDFVVFGVSPHDYENFAYNFQEVRRYIRQLREIVLYYVEATTINTPEE